MRQIAVVVADFHSGHKLGLCNPDTKLRREDKGGPPVEYPRLSETQRYLWDLYCADVEAVARFAGRDAVTLFNLSDWMNGDKHPEQLMGRRLSDQTAIAVANMRPWFKRVKKIRAARFTQGTGAHDPLGGLTIEATGKLAKEYPRCDIETVQHSEMTLDGVKIDYRHRGPHPGSRKWLEGNTARWHLRSWMLDDIAHGVEPARLYFRGHYHRYRHVHEEILGNPDREADLWLVPAYCGMSYWARQTVYDEVRLVNGMVAVELIDGQVGRVLKCKHVLDSRYKETI